MWHEGSLKVYDSNFHYWMKVYDEPSQYGINGGKIEVGMAADCLLVDLNHPFMVADYSFISNMVYSADSSCIDTVICGGDILMLHKFIDSEQEILQEARECCRRLNK